MNALEKFLDYPFGDQMPDAGDTMVVAPGVKWIRMGLPFALNHINLWLLRDERQDPAASGPPTQGWTIVDCCIWHEQSRANWEQIFATQLEGLPILRVIVTHMHPDHIGMSDWICKRWGVALWISATDFYAARLASANSTGFGGQATAEFFASHGLTDPTSLEGIKARSAYYPRLVPSVPTSYIRLQDGATVLVGGRDWRCISGYGHAPEHIALYCDELRVLIGGDMMLPRISTNVSVYEVAPEANPLTQFLDSIDKFKSMPADTLTLPSHGKPFRGLHTRIAQLHEHHRDRLAEVVQACTERACHGMDIVPMMFKRELDLHQTTFALGEAIAHLHALWFKGVLSRQLDSDGIFRFRLNA